MLALRTLCLVLAALAGIPAVFLTAPGCSRIAESRVEETLNGLLPTYLGPATRYTTQVRASSVGAVLRGRVESIHVDGDGVHIPNGPVLDRLTLDLDDIAVDPKTKRLESVGTARFMVRVGEAELNRYLSTRRPGDRSGLLRVTLGQGTATLAARPALLARYGLGGLILPVTVEGRLIPRGDSGLDFVPNAARVLALPVPRPILGLVSRELNPVVDLSAVSLPLRIRTVEIVPGSLILSGDVPPDAILRAAASAP